MGLGLPWAIQLSYPVRQPKLNHERLLIAIKSIIRAIDCRGAFTGWCQANHRDLQVGTWWYLIMKNRIGSTYAWNVPNSIRRPLHHSHMPNFDWKQGSGSLSLHWAAPPRELLTNHPWICWSVMWVSRACFPLPPTIIDRQLCNHTARYASVVVAVGEIRHLRPCSLLVKRQGNPPSHHFTYAHVDSLQQISNWSTKQWRTDNVTHVQLPSPVSCVFVYVLVPIWYTVPGKASYPASSSFVGGNFLFKGQSHTHTCLDHCMYG